MLAARSDRDAKISALISAALMPLLGLLGIIVGLHMRMTVPDPANFVTRTALTSFVLEYSGISPLFAGIILGALFITAVGTGSGLALGIATVIDREIIEKKTDKMPLAKADGATKAASSEKIVTICIAAVMTVIMTVFIAAQNVTLGLIALAAYICVGVVVPVVIFRLSGSTADEYRAGSGQLSAFVLENLRGLDETIQFGAGESRINDLKLRADSLAVKQEKMSKNMGLNAAITNSVILIFDLVMLFSGIAIYNADTISFSQLVISVIAMMSSFGPVVALANLGSVLQNTLASGNRVLDILDEQPVTDEITDGRDISFSGAVAQNVTFAYGNETILDDFTLGIEQGKITGIVGKSGSGKSTFLKLLMRFWETHSGEIKISDTNIDQINTKSLRSNESFVTQDTQLFHETIEYNVKIAKLNASHDEVVIACKKASIHDFIMTLPDGYETQVGELGDTLSGGERQRIGLARAFLHDAPLRLLDEPTSNRDTLDDAVIVKSLMDKDEDKTVVLVSHRPSTMRICDVAYSVENGRMS